MASVNFKKIKTAGEAKAIFRHCDEDERLKHEHENQQIDKSKTGLNSSIPGGYKKLCNRYDTRIKELDSLPSANKRKDRVTLMSLEFPVPKDLPRDNYLSWFLATNRIIKDKYGDENVLGFHQHYDEEHEYMHPETQEMRMSRVHEHIYVVPEHDGKLNCKWCSNRANMIDLNNRIHEMTVRDYGVEFMDGSKAKSKSEVNELKNASRQAELKAREDALRVRTQKVLDREKKVNEISSNLSEKIKHYNTSKSELNNHELKLKVREKDLDTRESDLKAQIDVFNKRVEDFPNEAEKMAQIANKQLKKQLEDDYKSNNQRLEERIKAEDAREASNSESIRLGRNVMANQKLGDVTSANKNTKHRGYEFD